MTLLSKHRLEGNIIEYQLAYSNRNRKGATKTWILLVLVIR